MKKLKLFPKTFLYTFSLMLVIVLLSHMLIYFLMLWVYDCQKKRALEKDVDLLVGQVMKSPDQGRLAIVTDFASKWTADISITYEGYSYEMDVLGTVPSKDVRNTATIIADASDSGIKISLAENHQGGADYFQIEKIFSNGNGYITAVVSRQQIEDAVSVIMMILPFTAVLCIVISVIFALAYSRMLTNPMKQISAVTGQMRSLQPDAYCEIHTEDEIGQLADNVNELYQVLLSTIGELELEVRKVEEAEEQKINFLRAASHELKTPVTAVNAMLENMLLNVGKYKDRDTYIAKCKVMTERLAEMIKDILDASKIGNVQQQELKEIDLAGVITEIMEPYQMIAKSSNVDFTVDCDHSFTEELPVHMFEKVISNLLSNAVAYTHPGGRIYIYFEERQLVIENECDVIPPDHLSHIFEAFYRPDYGRSRASGGNGLGLYIVASVLKSLHLPYEFVPSKKINGMTFRIQF